MPASLPAEKCGAARRERLRVVIVEPNLMVVAQIKHAIIAAGLEVDVAVAQTAGAALDEFRARQAHLGIIGLSLPDLDGLDLIRQVMEARRVFRVLVVSARRDERTGHFLRPGQVDGFLNPEVDGPERLAGAIRQVAEGGVDFSHDPLGPPAAGERARPKLHQMFTEQQQRGFAVVGAGNNDRQAGKTLGLAARTVHNHRVGLMRKFGVSTGPELMPEALRSGVVRVTPQKVLRPGFGAEIAAQAKRRGGQR
jgi:DNA-binding NarL/FixJ family response regulator